MASPFPALIACEAGTQHRLWVKYADGVYGFVSLGDLLELGAFALLRDPNEFAAVRVRDGAATWDAGVRLDPEVLYYNLIIRGTKRADGKTVGFKEQARIARRILGERRMQKIDRLCARWIAAREDAAFQRFLQAAQRAPTARSSKAPRSKQRAGKRIVAKRRGGK